MKDGHIASIDEGIVTDMEMLLDFVERWNKMDKEVSVAGAAARISDYLSDYKLDDEEKYDGLNSKDL